jgi:hypothetical protein
LFGHVTYPPQDPYEQNPYGEPSQPGMYPPASGAPYGQQYPPPYGEQPQYGPPPGGQYPPQPGPGGYPPGGPPAPQWPPQPGPAPGAPSGGSNPLPWILAGVGALVLVLVIAGVAIAVSTSGDKPKPTPPDAFPTPGVTHLSLPPPTYGSDPTGGPSGTAAAGGPTYKVDTDLCGKLKYPSLGDWATTKKRSDQPRKGGTGMADSYKVDCHDEFQNGAPGNFSDIDVEAAIFASASDAQDAYKISSDIDHSRFDRTLTGYGDEAYSTYRTWTPGFNTSDFSIVMRSGNLVLHVTVSVSVSGNTFFPKDTMLGRVGPTTQAVFALIPKA